MYIPYSQPNDASWRFRWLLFTGVCWLITSVWPLTISAGNSFQNIDSNSASIHIEWSKVPADVHGCRTIQLDLQERKPGEKISLEMQISNDTSKPVNLASSSSTCGCISQPPRDVTIEPKESFKHLFSLNLPKQTGELKRQINFFSDGGIPLLELDLSATIVPILELPATIEVNSEELQLLHFTAKLRNPLEETVDLQIQFTGPEVIVAAYDRMNERVTISIDPKKNPGVSKSILPGEIRIDGIVACKMEMELRYPHRVSVSPSKLLWVPIPKSQKLKSQLLVLHQALKMTGLSKSNVLVVILDEKGATLPIQVELLSNSKFERDRTELFLQANAVADIYRARFAEITIDQVKLRIPCESVR